MSDKLELLSKSEITELSNELVYRRFLMNKEKTQEIFQKIELKEYVALHIIEMESVNSSIYGGKTYLKDLSDRMQLTIRQTSRMIGKLKDSGLVTWSHDGKGSEGTYVTITETGHRLLEEQEEILKDYYGRVIEKFGKDRIIELLQMMKQLETVMSIELENRKGAVENGGEN